MRTFTSERGWEGYHDPKSLILALVAEVGELSELFQWLPADQTTTAASKDPLRSHVSAELADVLLYVVRLANADRAASRVGRDPEIAPDPLSLEWTPDQSLIRRSPV